MPLIDLHCHIGTSSHTRALKPLEFSALKSYADQFGIDTFCVSAPQAAFDIDGGSAFLAAQLAADPRARGWLSLSIHNPDHSAELARKYLVKTNFCGVIIEPDSEADVITSQGGRDLLNSLRRYSKPTLIYVNSPETLLAAVEVAREFTSLKFLISPQDEHLTRITPAAMKEAVNAFFLPVAGYSERDIVATAVEVLGERRVMWASNCGAFHPAAALGMIKDSALTASQRERVSLRNARELLG
jgi:hypothetical protein